MVAVCLYMDITYWEGGVFGTSRSVLYYLYCKTYLQWPPLRQHKLRHSRLVVILDRMIHYQNVEYKSYFYVCYTKQFWTGFSSYEKHLFGCDQTTWMLMPVVVCRWAISCLFSSCCHIDCNVPCLMEWLINVQM